MRLIMPAIRRGGGGGFVSLSWMHLASLVLIFGTTTTNYLPSFAAAITEREILHHLYSNANGANWVDSWDINSTDICSPADYFGVTCNNDGHVTEIHLPDNNLAGSISPYIYTLPHLKRLDFSKNRITSAGWDRIDIVLEEDDMLADVEVIELTDNLINSVEDVSKLSNSLIGLHMSYNNLRGTIPSELFKMKRLEILALSENELTGEIDTRIGGLTNLIELYCYGNKLTGEIPSEIGSLTKMKIITLSENQLTGPLPEEIKAMGNLQTFSVHNNDPNTGTHTGPLPKFDTHPFLNEVYLDGNDFTGTIPHNFLHAFNGTEGETVTIGLENNNLTGTIPSEFLKFDSLVLNVVGNKIEGFGSNICDVDANEENKIDGWMNGLVQLFGCNAILCPVDTFSDTGRQEEEETPCEPCSSGTDGLMGATTCDDDVVVDTSGELEILAEFYLALSGPEWGESGGWEAFKDLESPMDLTLPSYQEENIDPCTNNFYGIVCENGSIVAISLSTNGLEGLVPSSLFDLPNLRELDLSGNEISLDRDFGFGDIGNAVNLRKVNLSSNDIQTFKGLGKATQLEELTVDDAYFFHSLDTELYQLTRLTHLQLKFSGLKGKIPEGLSALTDLKLLDLYGNELSGTIPVEIGEMTKLWHVDFSENEFTGHLPTDAIAKLVNLQKFHVHQSGRGGPGITGKLPSFKEQTMLHMLDLNSNAMTGSIPSTFLSGIEDVDQLMAIDIGYNVFTGTIPGSLSRFSNMRFDAANNQITKVNGDLCNQRGWFNGEVGRVIDDGGNGCDAILCPKGTYNAYGRAKSGTNGGCLSCPNGEYAGAIGCDGITDDDDNLEQKILDRLFIETGGSNWTKKNNWENGTVCEYEGVTCSIEEENGNEGVEEINLAGFGLTARIPTQIYKLPFLKRIDFSNNNVDLSFEGIDQALNLVEIIIEDADLTSIEGISEAPSLTKLHISRNSFPDGDIPDEVYEIGTLESLAISNNGFEGSLSEDISNLSNLKEFWAGSNEITGTLPTEISQLSRLTSIVLSFNRMSGEIPTDLESIPTLRQLHLNGQRDSGGFTGRVPSFKNSEHLHDIDLSKNSLTGSIHNDFLQTVRESGRHQDYAYSTINLASNQITGTIPSDWDDFVGLFVDLTGNRISGVPEVLCDDDDEFMHGLIGNLTENKCDAILCPPGTSSPVGRQDSVNAPCQPCPGTTAEERKEQAPYFGMLTCVSTSKERKILTQLHDLIFTGASVDTHWSSDEPICSWYGITCNNATEDSGITEIKLESNSLVTDDPDKVSALFFDLPYLEKLNIRGNDGLPLKLDNVGNPPHLEMLQLSATNLTTIAGVGNAAMLKELHFTENDIEGTFPHEIFNLTALEKLYISFNKISGTLPTRIGELTGLREFYAYTNEMTGELPSELGNLVYIENLVLGKNHFEGNLPTQLNKLDSLKEFSVYSNEELTGPVLDFSKVSKIEKLDLEGNRFTGQIPSTFLSGLDSDYIASADNEIIIHLADNAFTGTLPGGLSSIANLYFDIVGNQFTEVPPAYCKDAQSSWMNGKVGELKDDPCRAIACPVNTFSVTGRMHSDGDETCTACGSLEVAPFVGSYSCTHTAKEITALKALYKGTDGDSWEENEHWMDISKPICSWYGVECAGDSLENTTITAINLPANSLNGTMPHEIWELPALRTLNLKENTLYMHFANIDKAKKLETLYISEIDIGDIDGIGNAPALKELHLTANQLTGTIPEDFFNLADTLERLYIAYNSFSGTLSTEFGKMTKLIDFYAYDNDFEGTIPTEIASLKDLQNFVVAENMLTGSIPEEFSYMPQLKLFSAYRRLKNGPKLSGHLPSFSNVPNLEGLYLDYNHLVGTIPSNFLKSSLKTELITLSHNLLTGEVPVELAVLDDLNIELEGNRITQFDSRFCENLSWMDGFVEKYGCDAVLCEPGYHSIYGRQNSTDSACQKCAVSDDNGTSPYWGSTSCEGIVNDREILELLYSETRGDDWYNNDNWMETDDICDWYGIECRDGVSVQAIRLGANNLVGTPPKEIFHLRQLHTLWLHSNPIDFKFEGIGKAQNLIDLRLDSTGLSDVFGVEEATTLIKLDLKFNQLSGSFPTELFNLGKLESLSLTENSLTGALPHSFGKLVNLVELRLGSNLFSGQLKTFDDFVNLIQLDLSENDLAGPIPTDFLGSISSRKPIEVDLSSNGLTGSVPPELDRFDKLVLFLRNNRITKLSSSLCDSSNKGWNMGQVALFGCDAILCPPRTANFHGRQSSESEPCLTCESNANLYGQITCDGIPLEASSSSPLIQGAILTLVLSVLVEILLIH